MSKATYGTYNWAVGSIRINLTILGLWENPKSAWNKLVLSMPISIINIYLFTCAVIPQTWALYRVRKYMILAVGNVSVVTTYYFCIFKMSFLLYKRNVIHDLFVVIKEDWEAAMSESEKGVMMKYWSLIRRVHYYALVIAIILDCVFHSTHFFHLVVRVPTNLTDTLAGRLFVHSSVYPFDTQTTPTYELLVFNEFFEGMTVCLTVLVADVLYSALVFHTCGQLEILAKRIESIAQHPVKDFYRLLQTYVRHHVRIIKFSNDIDDLFNIFLLLLLFHFTLAFCSQAFMASVVMEYSSTRMELLFRYAFFASYTCYLLFLTFLYCWAGENLMTKSENIYKAAYNCNWTKLPPNMAMAMGFILLRSQKPLSVTAGKFITVTLNTYAKLLKTCGGYISMMVAINR